MCSEIALGFVYEYSYSVSEIIPVLVNLKGGITNTSTSIQDVYTRK